MKGSLHEYFAHFKQAGFRSSAFWFVYLFSFLFLKNKKQNQRIILWSWASISSLVLLRTLNHYLDWSWESRIKTWKNSLMFIISFILVYSFNLVVLNYLFQSQDRLKITECWTKHCWNLFLQSVGNVLENLWKNQNKTNKKTKRTRKKGTELLGLGYWVCYLWMGTLISFTGFFIRMQPGVVACTRKPGTLEAKFGTVRVRYQLGVRVLR